MSDTLTQDRRTAVKLTQRRTISAAVGLTFLLAVAGRLSYAEEPPHAKGDCTDANDVALNHDFLVLPIQTDLQRLGTRWEFAEAKAFVLIDGTSAIKGADESLDANALKLSRLWESLAPISRGGPGNVIFNVWCRRYAERTHRGDVWPATSILLIALKQFGRDVGFANAAVDVFYLSETNPYVNDWKKTVATFGQTPSDSKPKEKGVGNQRIRLYPVRTPLSRLLFNGADCVVDISSGYDFDAPSAVQTIKQLLPEIGIEAKNKLVVLDRGTKVKGDVSFAQKLIAEIQRDSLGFKQYWLQAWQQPKPEPIAIR